MTPGTEWYVMRDGVIAEIRAYYTDDRIADSQSRTSPMPSAAISRASDSLSLRRRPSWPDWPEDGRLDSG
jgi:hypothetical protein